MLTFKPTNKIKTSSSFQGEQERVDHEIWRHFTWLPKAFHELSSSIQKTINIAIQKLPDNHLLTVNASGFEEGITTTVAITLAERIKKNKYDLISQAKFNRSLYNFPQKISASTKGEIHGIAQSNIDQGHYLLGWDNKGKQLFSKLLQVHRSPGTSTDAYDYSSIDHDNKGNLYITGFFDDYNNPLIEGMYGTHVFIEKRDAKTGKLIWRQTPFVDQINGSIRNGSHPTLLTTDGKVLVSGSGYFQTNKNEEDGTYIAILNPRSGKSLEQVKVNDNSNYLTEFATLNDKVYFSTDNESFVLNGTKAAASGNELWDFSAEPKHLSDELGKT